MFVYCGFDFHAQPWKWGPFGLHFVNFKNAEIRYVVEVGTELDL